VHASDPQEPDSNSECQEATITKSNNRTHQLILIINWGKQQEASKKQFQLGQMQLSFNEDTAKKETGNLIYYRTAMCVQSLQMCV
jgi:hypothetical protein